MSQGCDASANATRGTVDEWRRNLVLLATRAQPSELPEARWQRAIRDGLALLDTWGDRLTDCGWTAEDLFGMDPVAPWHRVDALGLVLLLDGGKVADADQGGCNILTRSGARQPYFRREHPQRVLLWDWRPARRGCE
jgi:hypothetical protein